MGEEISARLLRDHKKPTNNSKVILWFAAARGLPDGKGLETIQVQMPEVRIIPEICQHGAPSSNCRLTPQAQCVTHHYPSDL